MCFHMRDIRQSSYYGRCAGVRVDIDEVEACLDSHSAVQASAVACIESPTGSLLAGRSRVPDPALQSKPSGRLVILRDSCSRCTEVCPSTTARRVNLQHVDGHTISGRGCWCTQASAIHDMPQAHYRTPTVCINRAVRRLQQQTTSTSYAGAHAALQ